MNIENMSDEKKSMMLAKLVGWGVVDIGFRQSIIKPDGLSALVSVDNLYNPANMALAWRVLNWAERYAQKDKALTFYNAWVDFADDKFSLFAMWSPEKAQRAWLDKILSLAIEAGMVELERSE